MTDTTTTPTTPNATEQAITQAVADRNMSMTEKMVAGLRRAGVSEEAIKHACESDGVEMPKAKPAAGPDLRTPEQRELDEAGDLQ